MKHSEIYDKHADRRSRGKTKKRVTEKNENWDRYARVSFKNYVRDVRISELEEDLDDYDYDYEDDAGLST